MIPQQWPREGPLDKLNEALDKEHPERVKLRRNETARAATDMKRATAVVTIILLTLLALIVIINLVLTFGYH